MLTWLLFTVTYDILYFFLDFGDRFPSVASCPVLQLTLAVLVRINSAMNKHHDPHNTYKKTLNSWSSLTDLQVQSMSSEREHDVKDNVTLFTS